MAAIDDFIKIAETAFHQGEKDAEFHRLHLRKPAFYGDDDFMTLWHQEKIWIQPPELKIIKDAAWPFIRRSWERLMEKIGQD